jgi:transcriptional regulator with XRE-family HTH domain
MKTFGQKIKARRKELKLSMQQLGDKCNVSKAHIFEIEKGNSSPTLGVLTSLAKALGIGIADLLDITIRETSSSERELLRNFRELSLIKQNQLIQIMKVL